jgi:hypothetical protein
MDRPNKPPGRPAGSPQPVQRAGAVTNPDATDVRDSFYYRAIRTKLSGASRAQHDLNDPPPETLRKKPLSELGRQEGVATSGNEPKGLDLDIPEQRRRFIEGKL